MHPAWQAYMQPSMGVLSVQEAGPLVAPETTALLRQKWNQVRH